MSYKEQLIVIYAENDMATVAQNESYQSLVVEYRKNNAFNCFRDKIAQYKGWIENVIHIQPSEKKQVTKSLSFINQVLQEKNDELFESCVELIEKAYANKWSDKQMQYFVDTSKLLKSTKFDYFLSFTQRNLSPMTIKKVNSDYTRFIEKVLGMKSDTASFRTEATQRNLVAKAIHHLLKEEGLEGFYFPDREEDTKKVIPKLREALDSHFIFVQIVQNVLFSESNPDNNICYYEYNSAKETRLVDDQIKFVNAEGSRDKLRKTMDIHPDYADWHKEMREQDTIILEFPKDIRCARRLEGKIRNNLSFLIRKHKIDLIENVPIS